MQQLHDRFAQRWQARDIEPLLVLAAYILDFLCVHPFLDGNGRLSRLLTLLLLYQGGFRVGRYISLERVVEQTREGYYEALKASSADWHEGAHSLLPWWEYFLGVVLHKAYQDFEARVGTLTTQRGAKREMIRDTIERLPPTFRIRDIEQAMPGVSRPTINRAIAELRDQGRIRLLRGGRDALYAYLSCVHPGGSSTGLRSVARKPEPNPTLQAEPSVPAPSAIIVATRPPVKPPGVTVARSAILTYTESQMAHDLALGGSTVSTTTATAPEFRSMEGLLGGAAVLRARPRATVDWVEVIRRGLPAAAVDALTESVHLTQGELSAALGISRRTLSRRKREGLLTSEESAKLIRLARVVERAEEVFEGLGPALEWLKAPNAAFAGDTPLSLLDTDLGAELVLDTLGRIEHGVFA